VKLAYDLSRSPGPALMVLGILLAGCAATGAHFEDHAAATELVRPGMSRVVVYRLEGFHKYTVGATVKLDGVEVGALEVNGFLSKDLAPGKHVLGVDLSLEPGVCTLPFEMPAGDTGYFLVAPRGENAAARAPGAIGFMLSQTILGGVASELVSDASAAVESAGKQCGGPFALVRVVPAAALPVLTGLRESGK
jgi:hypothetical protein